MELRNISTMGMEIFPSQGRCPLEHFENFGVTSEADLWRVIFCLEFLLKYSFLRVRADETRHMDDSLLLVLSYAPLLLWFCVACFVLVCEMAVSVYVVLELSLSASFSLAAPYPL